MTGNRVTVGVPVYNGEATLRRALEGAASQSFRDFDLVVSDNCSTDGTAAIIEEFQGRFKSLRVVRRPATVAALANFNGLLDEAFTEYFAWLAADDFWEPRFIESCLEKMDKNPPIVTCFTDFRVYHHFSEELFDLQSYTPSASWDQALNFFTRLRNMAPVAIYGLHRTSPFKAVYEPYREGFDFFDVMITAATVRIGGHLAIVNEDLFRSGVRSQAAVRRQSLAGGSLRYRRFAKEMLALAYQTFKRRDAVAMTPYILNEIWKLKKHNDGVAQAVA